MREKQKFWLAFGLKRTSEAVILEMLRICNLRFRVRNSSGFNNSVGLMAVEFEGTPETIHRAVRRFKRKGVRVDPIELSVLEG